MITKRSSTYPFVCPRGHELAYLNCGTTINLSAVSRRSRFCSMTTLLHRMSNSSRRIDLGSHLLLKLDWSTLWPCIVTALTTIALYCYPCMYLTDSNIYLNNGIRLFGTTNPLLTPAMAAYNVYLKAGFSLSVKSSNSRPVISSARPSAAALSLLAFSRLYKK